MTLREPDLTPTVQPMIGPIDPDFGKVVTDAFAALASMCAEREITRDQFLLWSALVWDVEARRRVVGGDEVASVREPEGGSEQMDRSVGKSEHESEERGEVEPEAKVARFGVACERVNEGAKNGTEHGV